MSGAARVLVVEDNATQAELARALIGGLGHEVRVAGTAALALATAQDWQPDAILLDVELPDYNGFELMVRLKSAGIDAAVLVVTANGSVNSAVEAMRAGAVDFLVKPYAKARLSVTLGNVLESRALRAELGRVRARLERDSFFGFIGASAPMQAAYRTIESVAASRASVFITGESGTGKELAAEAIHKASPRVGRGFVALNCGAIPRELLESEVFGHIRGAFTGAAADRVGAARLADGGTLFLDEIGEMPLEMQVKLLRFVQTGSFAPVGASRVERVDVRFVCATNRDPMIEVQEGRFREDLFYRLHVVPLELPPLRAREGDVLLIARHFLTSFAREEGRRFERFSPEAEARLAAYAWPGNVRQLQNVVRNVVVLHDGAVVEAAMLPPPLGAAGEGGGFATVAGAARPTAPVPPRPAMPPITPPITSPFQAPEPNWIPRGVPLTPPPIAPPPVAAPPAAPPSPAPPSPAPPSPDPPPASAGEMELMPLAEMERRLALVALRRTGFDVTRAAALLEIHPSTLYRKLKAWQESGVAQ